MEKLLQHLAKLLQRNADSHKGDFGHVLIIGGDYGMGGAAIMSAEAAYRAGAGKVSVLTRQENIAPLLERVPSAMTILPNASEGEIFKNKDVIAIGMGLGKSKWASNLLLAALQTNLPKIIDADALNLIAGGILDEEISNKTKNIHKRENLQNSIITPHVGEASRLLACSPEEIQQNRLLSAKKLHEKFGAIVVLKGHKTIIYDGKQAKEESYECQYGNPGMAVAGMGDVLSGLIAGLVAQKLSLAKAAILGVNIHAYAGDMVANKKGEIGMLPTDLLNYFPEIIKWWRQGGSNS